MKLNPEHPNPLPPRIYCSKDLNKTILQKFPQLLKNWTILLGASMLLFQFPKVYSHPLRGPRIIQPNATTMTSTQYKNLQKSLLQSSAVGNFIKVLLGFELCDLVLGHKGSNENRQNGGSRSSSSASFFGLFWGCFEWIEQLGISNWFNVFLVSYSLVTTRLPGITVILTYTVIYKIINDIRAIVIITINHSSFQDSYWDYIHTLRDYLTDVLGIVLIAVNLPIICYVPVSFYKFSNSPVDGIGCFLAFGNWFLLVLDTVCEYFWGGFG